MPLSVCEGRAPRPFFRLNRRTQVWQAWWQQACLAASETSMVARYEGRAGRTISNVPGRLGAHYGSYSSMVRLPLA